jgi:hypothetical protein
MSKKTPANVIRVRKNKRRPAGASRWAEFKASKARFKRAMDTTNATRESGLRGLDLMTNVNYYKENGCLPENCGMGMKNPKVS